MSNKFIKIPSKGDAVVGNLLTGKVQFIKRSSFVLADLDLTKYEKIGFVGERYGHKVLIGYYQNASKPWCDIYQWKVTGYTLDGTDRTGVLSIRDSSAAVANTDYTVSYNASTVEELVSQLNAFFTDTTNPVFQTQDWIALVENEEVKIHCAFSFYQMATSNTGKNGFTLTADTLADVTAYANMRRRHGGNGGEGSISNLARAFAYFRPDNSSTTYNPSADVTDIKRGYPVCLPAYLGTSTHQSDHCALLRQTYGEGEAGWIKFMESCRPVVPTDYGNMGMHDGQVRGDLLASKVYSSQRKTDEPMCKAAKYCADIATTCLPAGKWHLPTTEELYHILDGVQHGTTASRDADPINEILNKMGGNAISNGSNYWSCLRSNTYLAWLASGNNGYFYNYYFCSSYLCVPVSLYELR